MNAIAVLPKPPYTLYAANGAKLYVYDTQSNAEVLVRLAVKKISNLEVCTTNKQKPNPFPQRNLLLSAHLRLLIRN